MLALVALFTGAFLVFSTQFLALLRRRTQLALLRVLGITRGRLLRFLLGRRRGGGRRSGPRSASRSAARSRVSAIERLGGDLGAGYFSVA